MIQKPLRLAVVFDRKHISTASTSTNPQLGLIQMRCQYDKRTLFIAIASVYADQFGRKVKGKLVGETVHGRDDAEEINDHIANVRKTILDEYNRCSRLGIAFSLDKVDPKMKCADNRDFLRFMTERIKVSGLSKSTINTLNNTVCVLKRYGKIRTFDDLTTSNIDDFDKWMMTQRALTSNGNFTAAYRRNVHIHINRYIRDAIMLEYMVDDPYRKFKKPRGKSNPRVILDENDVQKLIDYKADDEERPSCQKDYLLTRDLFLIQCYTGLSCADLLAMDWPAVKETGMIRKTRKKTGVQYTIKLIPQAIAILDKHKWKIPKIKSCTYNVRLEHIGKKAGLTKHLSSHIGRHTFATTFGLKLGVPLEVISKILGHNDISTTQIYAKVLDSQIVDAFDNISNKIK